MSSNDNVEDISSSASAAIKSDDPGWKYCIPIGKGTNKVQCKFCSKVMCSGITRGKEHLMGKKGRVSRCEKCPKEVRAELWAHYRAKENEAIEKEGFQKSEGIDLGGLGFSDEDDEEAVRKGPGSSSQARVSQSKRKSQSMKGPMDLFCRNPDASIEKRKKEKLRQTSIKEAVDKEAVARVHQYIARFWYQAGLSFNTITLESFEEMVEAIGSYGRGLPIPSYHDMRVGLLNKELDFTNNLMKNHREEWYRYGCTIMSDGWTDRRHRTVINFLVNSPSGSMFIKSVDASGFVKTGQKIFELLDSVVEEIGEENVLQVVTDNGSNYVSAGKLLMEKRKHLYWTPCAAHCIDLMLEDIGKLPLIKKTIKLGVSLVGFIYSHGSTLSLLRQSTNKRELVRPAITRFATSFLSLERIHKEKANLRRMFTSEEWTSNKLSKEAKGKQATKTVLAPTFWRNVVYTLKIMAPLVRVLRLVDGDKKPAMGYIYEAMEKAKETIMKSFKEDESRYKDVFKIIDHRWDCQLHQPLHAAGHFLNPEIFYSNPDVEFDMEITNGLYACFRRLVASKDDQEKIMYELTSYKNRMGLFADDFGNTQLKKISPAQWWRSFGHSAPTLQKLAIKILSLTCSASGCERNWSVFEQELKREDPTGVGGPSSESYVLDSRAALVERRAVISRERLILGHCLVLSIFVERASTEDVKDIFLALRECAVECSGATDTMKHQIICSLLYSLVIAFISDALSTVPERVSVLSQDTSFTRSFNEIVMATGNDPVVEGFVGCVRFAWVVHLMLVQDGNDVKEITTSSYSNDMKSIYSCLEVIFANNVFQFWLDKILRSAAYQNDDEDMVYVYNAYLHKLMTCFLSHPLARDKVKETKERAMAMLSPYRTAGTHNQMIESSAHPQETYEIALQPFVSLLEFVSEIYQKEPELLSGSDVIWTFVKFSGEDHTNFQTLVAFLKMLSSLACTPEGASKVFELLHAKTFRSIGWSTLFDCLSIYEEKFKQSFQSPGVVLPEFQEGDAKALVAYLSVLKKVVENGNPVERKNWFTDIEPLFKLLSYENVPPYLKGALRNAIASFVHVSPIMKETIWRYLEQYDLPVVLAPSAGNAGQTMETQVYDMRFELNEIEARREQYPSTISFINLLNTLMSDERDVSDRGHRFIGIFRFVYDHVFGPFPQRAYADPSEKWQLVVACLTHFQMMLSMYDVGEEDSDACIDQSQNLLVRQSYPIHMQLPVVEIMKDFMSGKTLFRNILGIVLPGVNLLITERTNQTYGPLLEKAVLLSLEIVILVMEKDSSVSDFWRPLYQPLDVILSQDHNQIVALLEYIRYDFQPQIQLCSIKILSILSSRMVGLSQLLLKSNTANSLIEDYAACLEMRSEASQVYEESSKDPGVLIMQLLIDNISRPAPNITHLLLKFDFDGPVERTLLQPKFQYSCLKVILDILDKILMPDVNAWLHEFGFQLLYELCVDPLTSAPTMDLLCTKKYQFYVKHLSSIGIAPLPKSSEILRTSSLHQRAWLLKLLAVELHSADITDRNHRESCKSILTELFGQTHAECGIDHDGSNYILHNDTQIGANGPISKSKVLELLGVIQFESPDVTLKSSQFISSVKYSSMAEDILRSPTTSGRGVYFSSERGDRLIDLTSLRDRLWQKFNLYNAQSSTFGSEAELSEIREAIQQLLRWGWKYNKNLEEQAAQLHMLTSWSQIVEISASQRISFLENRSDILFKLLDATLNFSCSPECSLKMAQILTQVGLTCMAKLRDERFVLSSDSASDTVTCLDIIMSKQLSNGACRSILFKLIMAILRNESSEALRRRQYALLLSYFQYCQHILDSDVPTTILQFLSEDGQEDEELDLEKIDKDQAELAHANFAILRKEDQSILNMVIKDATQGSESIKTISLYVLDALIRLDHEKFFLSQLETRGFLRSCFMSISNFSYQDGGFSLDSMQRLCTLEAELSLLLRISHKYGRLGSQHLFSMGSLQHIASCRALHLPIKGNIRRLDSKMGKNSFDVDKQRMVVAPTLRFLFSLTSLVDTSEFLEVKNKVVREIIEFIKGHQLLFDQILQEDLSDADELTMEIINLVVGILSKVWPYEESDKYGFVQGLFGMMCSLFSRDPDIFTSIQSLRSEIQQKADVGISRLCFSLSTYLYFLVTKKSLRLQVSDGASASASLQPTLACLAIFLGTLATALEKAAEEKYLLLNKIKDINELSRQEVDEIINLYLSQDYAPSSESIQKRRYIAMLGMCRIVGHRSQLIMLLLLLSQNLMNIILAHFQDSSYAHDHRRSQKAIAYDTSLDAKEDMHSLCGELVSVLERLELLSEGKTGHSLEVFRRLARSLKEMSIQKLSS